MFNQGRRPCPGGGFFWSPLSRGAGIIAAMRRVFATVLLAAFLAGCGGGGYKGYKTAPYTIRGVRYEPMQPREAVGYVEEGVASHYKHGFLIFPGQTALGEKIYAWSKGAAHKTLPLPSKVRVTNLENGKRVVVRVNDRGPFIEGRVIDVTANVAKKLGFYDKGLARVRVEVLSVGDGKYRVR
jgi:rare lipoprotein A